MNETDDGSEAKQRRWQLYTEHVKQTWQDIQSSTDSFDQSLLAISSGALGISLAFIKDIVPLTKAVKLPYLFASWFSFVLCIVVTVLSFRLSIVALEEHLQYLHKYYQGGDEKYLSKRSGYSKALTVFTWLAAISLLSGLICTMIFCVTNVSRKPG